MTGKCFRRIFLSSFITLMITFVIVVGVSQHYFLRLLVSDISVEAEYAAHGMNVAGDRYLDDLVSSHRVTLIAADGTVVYDNQFDTAALSNHSDRQEFIDAVTFGEGSATRYSDTVATRYLYHAVLLDDGRVIRVSAEHISTVSLAARLFVPLLVALGLMAVFSYVLARQISGSIRDAAEAIDLDSPDSTINCPEMSPLLGKIDRLNFYVRENIAQLSRKQEEFGVITENMSEGFVVVSRRGEVLSYNSSALRILDHRLSALTAEQPDEPLKLAVDTALKGHRSEQTLRLDGAVYRIIASPVYHSSDVSGAVVVILDVTEKESLEQMRREFTANVSHELKTPLTSIRGAAELLAGGLVQPDDIPAFAATIHKESGRLVSLIEDILQLSRLDEEGIAPEKSNIELQGLCASVVERLKPAAQRIGVTLEQKGNAADITGIPTMIEELVYNLCDNAIKYNVPAGKVTVTTGTFDGRPYIEVADTGIGIAKEHMGRIFERFYRVDKSRSRALGGTGLGLSIVKHAAAKHSAEIHVDSEEGRGTVITVMF